MVDFEKIPCMNICVGDIVFMENGDKVPADIILLATHNSKCKVDSTELRGEFLFESKKPASSNIGLSKDL